jgi:SRSO17 transposase
VHYRIDKATPPSQTLVELAAQMRPREWKQCEWTSASGQNRTTRLAWCELYLQADLDQGGMEKHWLVVDWPEQDPEPYRYYIAHFHQPPSRARCLKLSRSRWQIEQFFQRAKTDLGLDHFEGRSWRGFHHHLVLCVVAYLFLLSVHLRSKKNFWCDVGTDAESDPTIAGEIDRLLPFLPKQV